MPTTRSLEQIIRQECLPLRDCMLTITDARGEAAFLYFKEGELIEANYSALWGKDALAQIVTWTVTDQTVAPLPLGIKRSLWDKLEFLLHPGLTPTPSGRLPKSARSEEPVGPFDRFKAVPNLLAMIYLENGKPEMIFESEEGKSEKTEWLTEFSEHVKLVGETLGFGGCEKWTVDTDRFQVVSLSHDAGFIVMLRGRDIAGEDLEAAVKTATGDD